MTDLRIYNFYFGDMEKAHTHPTKTNTGPRGMLINVLGRFRRRTSLGIRDGSGPIVVNRTIGILVRPATGTISLLTAEVSQFLGARLFFTTLVG